MPGGCGCGGSSCSCMIVAGPGLRLTGTGNASAPFTISIAPAPGTITINAAGPLDLSANGGYAVVAVALNANATSVVLPTGVGRLDLIITQGAGGTRTITWPAAVLFPGGTDPVLSTANGAVDWITLVSTGTVWAGIKTAGALA